MRIAFDVSYIQTKPHGYRRYATELLRALVEQGEEHQWVLHGWSASLDRQWLASLRRPGVEFRVRRLPGQCKRFYWNTLRLPAIERLIGPFDIFHSTDPLLPPTRRKSVITIHDLVYVKFPDLVESRVVRWDAAVRANALRADAIVADSAHTKSDIVELFGIPESKVHVVYPIVSPLFTHNPSEHDEEVIARYDLLRPYILFVSTIEPRKNVIRLLEAYDRMKDSFKKEVHLVVVGREGWKTEATVYAIRAHERSGCVRWLRDVRDTDLAALYRRALMFVFPSLYEGFGFPVAEAMASGTPVITSRAGSLSEIAGNAAVLVNPTSTEELTAAMAALAHDDAKRRELRRLGIEQARLFNYRNAVDRILSIYKTLS